MSKPLTNECPAQALRMIFAFDGEQMRLVSQQHVDMVVPPSDPLQGMEGQAGFWYELRDAQDRPLYRQIMDDPMQNGVEVFADDPKQSIARHSVPSRKGVFVVLVPDIQDGHTLTLSSSPPRTDLPAREILRVDLRRQ